MNKQRLQQKWDFHLLSNWDENGRYSMSFVIRKFISECFPNKNIEKINDFLVELGLSRCLDFGSNGDTRFIAFKQDVIGFINARCQSLSDDLISGKSSVECLIDIDEYKWKPVRQRKKCDDRVQIKKEVRKNSAIINHYRGEYAFIKESANRWGSVKTSGRRSGIKKC